MFRDSSQCGPASSACRKDEACEPAAKKVGDCVCAAEMSSMSTKACTDTFAATNATAKGLTTCVGGMCAAECGLN